MMLIITVLHGMVEVMLITVTQGERELRPKLSTQPVRLCPREGQTMSSLETPSQTIERETS